MKKLSKELLAQRDDIVGTLRSRFSDLEQAVEGFNKAMEEPWNALQAAVEDYNAKLDDAWGSGLGPEIELYNGAVADANAWKQEAAQSIQDYMDERSEKWQESDAAQSYGEWRDEFDHDVPTFDADRPEDVGIEQPEEIPFELEDAADQMEELPEGLDSGG